MQHELFGIPVPSFDQLIVGTELVFLLWPARRIQQAMDRRLSSAYRRERDRKVTRHVKAGHEGRLKHCLDVDCFSLRSRQPEQARLDPQPEVLELELHH